MDDLELLAKYNNQLSYNLEILEDNIRIQQECIQQTKETADIMERYISLLEGINGVTEELLNDRFWFIPTKWWKTRMAGKLIDVAQKSFSSEKGE